jgi:hypothetical protein
MAPRKAGPTKREKSCYLGPPTLFRLSQALWFVNRAFDEHCYLVGSALQRPDFRDVDVRMIMGDAKFELLFGTSGDSQLTTFWQLLCTSISLYLREQTGGLPVDFQIQSMSHANKRYPGKENPRHPLGMYVTDPPPAWEKLAWHLGPARIVQTRKRKT